MIQHVMRFIWHHPSFLFPLLFFLFLCLACLGFTCCCRTIIIPQRWLVCLLSQIQCAHTKSFWCPSLLVRVCVSTVPFFVFWKVAFDYYYFFFLVFKLDKKVKLYLNFILVIPRFQTLERNNTNGTIERHFFFLGVQNLKNVKQWNGFMRKKKYKNIWKWNRKEEYTRWWLEEWKIIIIKKKVFLFLWAC